MKTATQPSEAPAIFQAAENARVAIMRDAQQQFEQAVQQAAEVDRNMRTVARHIDMIVAAMAKVGLKPAEIRPSSKTKTTANRDELGNLLSTECAHVYISGEKLNGKFRFLQDTDQCGFRNGDAANKKQRNEKARKLCADLATLSGIKGLRVNCNQFSVTAKRAEVNPSVMLDFFIPTA